MTPAQEAKLDKLYDIVMEVRGDQKVHAEKHNLFTNAIAELARDSHDQDVIITSLVDDRNKAKGAIWFAGIFGGTGFFAGIGALIHSFFKS